MSGPAVDVRRRAWGLAAVAVAVGLALLAAAGTEGGPPTSGEEAPVIVALGPDQVRRIVVESAGQRAELTRNEAGVWRSRAGTPSQSAALLVGLEDALLPMRAYRSVRADSANPDFALARPELTVQVEGRRGRTEEVLVGAPTFTGGGYYARRASDEDRLFLVPRSIRDGLRTLLAGKPVTSADPLLEKAEAAERAMEEKPRESVYLKQVLGAGAQVPPEAP